MKYKNYTILLILAYLWILVTNPHARFDIIGTLHLEKVLIILSWITLITSGKMKAKFNAISGLIILFFFWLLLSFSLSQYSDTYLAQHWLENYWKNIVLYFLILFAINEKKDIYVLISGYVVIIALYQMHSWMDFLSGGSYVYQQGIKRMIGIWSNGIGSANYYGMITMLSLPFAYFWFSSTESRQIKRLLVLYAIMTFASVFFSGTRGALIGVLVFVFLNMRSFRQVFRSLLLLTTLVSITYFVLPDYLQYRYFGLIVDKDYHVEINEKADEISKISAEDRMIGLYDGWDMALLKPMAGFGPGSSPLARKLVNEDFLNSTEGNLQLHNLYGQIMSESGFVGLFLFMTTILVYLIKLKNLDTSQLDDKNIAHTKMFLQNFILLFLYYGMISHTLYRYYWFLVFAIHGGFLHIIYLDQQKNKSHH